jgi:hypothetical protein
MHPYATDSSERRIVPFTLAVLAIISALLVSKIFAPSAPWWFDMPAPLGFYGLYWTLFDRRVWRWPLLRSISLVRVPDFNGTWIGDGESSYRENGERKTYRIELRIKQEWTRFRVTGETAASRSESLIGAVTLEDGEYPSISYEYRNVPGAGAAAGMHAHPGMARLERINPMEIRGEYYTGRDRQNYGTLRLRRR